MDLSVEMLEGKTLYDLLISLAEGRFTEAPGRRQRKNVSNKRPEHDTGSSGIQASTNRFYQT